jgi:hypothetical protein
MLRAQDGKRWQNVGLPPLFGACFWQLTDHPFILGSDHDFPLQGAAWLAEAARGVINIVDI